MRPLRRRLAGTAVLAGGVAFALATLGAFERTAPSPWADQDLCFARDTPGASGRYVSYTPVSCADPSRRLAEEIGADLGTLSFRDVDGDGSPEMIVESSAFRCRFSLCYEALRVVAKVTPGATPPVRVIESAHLPDLAPIERP